jgi:hypothetical protein
VDIPDGRNFTVPVADVAVDAQRFLQVSGRTSIVARQPLHASQEGEGVGQAAPVADVAGDAQRASCRSRDAAG